MSIRKLFVLAVLAMSVSPLVHAENVATSPELKQSLEKLFGRQPDSVSQAPIPGLLEVLYGTDLVYVTDNGKYLMHGQIYDLNSRTNITDERLSGVRLKALNAVDESSMIVYKANGKEKYVITVFTDIDCPYCRKLHEGMKQMNDLGITVRYLAFPRAGIGSRGYNDAESVWCAADRNKAMDDAKLHGKIVAKTCDNSPVKAQYELGKKVGVTGTPAIFLSNGHMMPGYMPPQRLAAVLDKSIN